MECIIQAQNLDVGYGKNAVISDVNIDAMKGQVICLLGPNGAGKSTLMKCLFGIYKNSFGITCSSKRCSTGRGN